MGHPHKLAARAKREARVVAAAQARAREDRRRTLAPFATVATSHPADTAIARAMRAAFEGEGFTCAG